MTAYIVATTEIGKYEIAMTANTEDVVTFGGSTGDATISDLTAVEVKQIGGTKPVYFCFGTAAATVKGAHCFDVPPNTVRTAKPATSGDTVVHLICEATAVASVNVAG